ncbi:MAG TPA: glycosyltransferase family 1 protein [Terriglobia bacterium]|nr:glycosyltransferase family 1 protein [Terriglobia bacterium]
MARNICIDGLFLTRPYAWCGINRYLVNLLRGMGNISSDPDDPKMSILVPSDRDHEMYGIGRRSGFELVSCPAMRLRKFWRLGLLFRTVNTIKTDALFLPSPAPLHFKHFRLAITVHDIIPLLFPDHFRSLSGRVLHHSYIASLKRADLIFTDSEHSKNDLISARGIPPERVVVAPLGFDSELFNSIPPEPSISKHILNRYGISKPYLLHVGTIEPRKNLVRLAHAYRSIVRRQKQSPFQLVLCGRMGWGFEELLRLLSDPDLQSHVVMTGPVSDQELAVLYKNSTGCAMPSLYEGFGLPLLEAMASGVPVISSDRSCLPEIGGDAPIYFDPESVEGISEAMERLLEDSGQREVMVQRGLERAKLFSWEDCARKTLDALRDL